MRRRSPTALVAILILAAIVAWVDAPDIARPDWAKNLLFWRPAENRDIKIVEGGAERFDSIANALAALKPEAEFVAVHDAVRPCLTEELISKVFAEAEKRSKSV